MNMCMYSDDKKNLMMFLPDRMPEAEIMTLGAMICPDCDEQPDFFPVIPKKPTGCINLYNLHASYSIDSIFPDTFAPITL